MSRTELDLEKGAENEISYAVKAYIDHEMRGTIAQYGNIETLTMKHVSSFKVLKATSWKNSTERLKYLSLGGPRFSADSTRIL